MYDALIEFAKDVGYLPFNRVIELFEAREHVCTSFLHYPSRKIKICHDCEQEYPIDLRIEHQR